MEIDVPAASDADETKVVLEVDNANFGLQTVTIGDLQWIATFQSNDLNTGYLTLSCTEPDTKLWSIELLVRVDVYSNNADIENFYDCRASRLHTSNATHTVKMFYVHESNKAYYKDKKGNGLMNIEITATVGRVWKEDLTKITPFGSCYVVLGEKELFVSRELLSMNSNYFYEMFERNEETNVVENVTFEEIILFLCVVYPLNYPIDEDKCLDLLEIATKLQSSPIISKCTSMIERSDRLAKREKMEIAVRFGLRRLLMATINTMTQAEIEDLSCGPTPPSDELKLLLFERLVRIYKPVDAPSTAHGHDSVGNGSGWMPTVPGFLPPPPAILFNTTRSHFAPIHPVPTQMRAAQALHPLQPIPGPSGIVFPVPQPPHFLLPLQPSSASNVYPSGY
ncbi:hypothetical protein QR680_008939 [Steinernema hermaphroditum]|uniref:BTB domain-containing protein n=1 Tax=Steinernema hermaphroditum TaxID=289476 RepID=A0AA39IJW4_9BILA|nr:hypothetical protein QR680_008939 [Steinernema hermaphroditum]